ncbi:unnamed protein product [Rotaria sp. Silwood1]|nr:unnamed protein product [Rotaria sp. Silwood1]CAF0833222.1 unnamed protein product [Rotaria sp. Silwood1]CAF3338915.1 unnamed protein product [Rotaria sp. Silwood1]CAF3366086.1 unnamed protein product [Rotaria sp. Silwood1]CAF4683311.1 unnamed protein product [Rotaria sp. Silwood1]
MSIDNNKLWKTEIITPISSIQNINHTGARGDCVDLPIMSMISNRTICNTIDNKDEHLISSVNFENKTDDYFRSKLASGEPEQHQLCVSTSSATFIVSSSPPLDMTVQDDDHNIQNMIHSTANMELFTHERVSNNHQQLLGIKQYWILVTIITGIFMIFITIVTISIIY